MTDPIGSTSVARAITDIIDPWARAAEAGETASPDPRMVLTEIVNPWQDVPPPSPGSDGDEYTDGEIVNPWR